MTRWTAAGSVVAIPDWSRRSCYATLTGIATEPEVLRGVGWSRDAAGLRRLRDELRRFLRAALAP